MRDPKSFNSKHRAIVQFFMGGKVYLINPKFQYRFMANVILITIFSMTIIYGANYYFFDNFIAKGQELKLPVNHSFFVIIKQQQEFMGKIFLAVSLILTTVIGVWGLFYSHRIAGPLYRLNLYFREAANKKSEDLPPVNFRENDFFQEIPVAINTYLASVQTITDSKEDHADSAIYEEDKAS